MLLSDAWNCVATVFFLDTAHNVIDYIETIYKILQPGGCWINLGKKNLPALSGSHYFGD